MKWQPSPDSDQDLFQHFAADIGQTEVAAVETIGELRVLQTAEPGYVYQYQ